MSIVRTYVLTYHYLSIHLQHIYIKVSQLGSPLGNSTPSITWMHHYACLHDEEDTRK